MKPLFIPLKTKTCTVGRAVTLSNGYGKQERMTGTVKSFQTVKLRRIDGGLLRIAIRACFPRANEDTLIACIGIELGTGGKP